MRVRVTEGMRMGKGESEGGGGWGTWVSEGGTEQQAASKRILQLVSVHIAHTNGWEEEGQGVG